MHYFVEYIHHLPDLLGTSNHFLSTELQPTVQQLSLDSKLLACHTNDDSLTTHTY